ncbi:exosortase A [Massilia sp. BSC265]|uniref:exosortase A n=1 Tax=Massilia sp. BSC265 TaxID=1549812 RepID=UPI0004E89283|nr:exosortase A [Massilia sp. BSC265]KFI05141.1 exosortase [Massilia sp. BSC265]
MFLKPPPGVDQAAAHAAIPVPAPQARAGIAALAVSLVVPILLFYGTVVSMAGIWNSSETFAHGWVILPISLWLIWRQRAWFSRIPARPWWPGLVLMAGAGAAWLAGRMGDVGVVMQYAFVSMMPLAALTLLGPRLAAKFTFPLLFLLFAVPFGEIFVGPLIQHTADFTVWAVQATGIPVLRNGTRFELPSGSWSVVEACSGIRYLISSITLGCLYAYLTYQSNLRRAVFIGMAILVPIVANWLRAYGIVMIGHTSGMELATGVDHLVYGWLFFGVIMFIMFWIGSYWREDDKAAAPMPIDGAASVAPAPARTPAKSPVPATLAVVAMAAAWPAFAAFNDRANHNPQPVALTLPALGWPQTSGFPDWQVHYMEPDARIARTYRSPEGRPVLLQMLYYRNQSKQKGLISSINRLTGEQAAFYETASRGRTEQAGAAQLPLREAVLHGPGGPLLVWQVSWVDGHYTSSNVTGKLRQAWGKLQFRGDDGAMVAIAVPFEDTEKDAEAARATLRTFLGQHFGTVDGALLQARAH